MSDERGSLPEDSSGKVLRLVPTGSSLASTSDPYGVSYGTTGFPLHDQGGLGVDLLEYWRILIKRRKLWLSTLGFFVLLALVWALMQTPLYTSSVRLQIDYQAAKVIEGGNTAPTETFTFDFLRTQYEVMESRAVAERVASALKLGDDREFLKPQKIAIFGSLIGLFRQSEPTSPDSMQIAAVGTLLENRSVKPVPGSRVVSISYSDPSPQRAQRIADAFADAFIASNLDKRFEANAYAKTFLEDQIKQLKVRLEESEKAALDFAQKEQIVATNEKESIAQNNLAAANTALGNLISERIKNEQLWRQVDDAKGIDLPQFLANSVIDVLRAKRKELVTEYQEKLETFKPGYPAMIQINNKIKEIDRQITSEVQTIKSSLKASYESSQSQEVETKARIETLRAEVLDLQKRSIQYNILKREADTNRELYNGLLQRFKEVDIAGGVGSNNVFIVDRADLPGSPSSPKILRTLLLAIFLGLGVGFGASYLVEHLDDTLHTLEDVERASGLSTLGVIPKARSDVPIEQELVDPRSALSESYRSLCTSLQFSTEAGLPKSLLITSAGPSEGKSITSLAIARHFASAGMKVLLVDADLRNPSLHKKLELENSIGLSHYLTGSCAPPETFQSTNVANLAFMASGPLPPNAADLLAGAKLHSLIAVGLEVFDLIVIDGPPVMGLADAPILSNAAEATIFVMGAGQARIGLVRGALRRLHIGRAPIIGAVLTKFDAKASGYGYGYGYGYSYGGADAFTYGAKEVADAAPPQRKSLNSQSSG